MWVRIPDDVAEIFALGPHTGKFPRSEREIRKLLREAIDANIKPIEQALQGITRYDPVFYESGSIVSRAMGEGILTADVEENTVGDYVELRDVLTRLGPKE